MQDSWTTCKHLSRCTSWTITCRDECCRRMHDADLSRRFSHTCCTVKAPAGSLSHWKLQTKHTAAHAVHIGQHDATIAALTSRVMAREPDPGAPGLSTIHLAATGYCLRAHRAVALKSRTTAAAAVGKLNITPQQHTSGARAACHTQTSPLTPSLNQQGTNKRAPVHPATARQAQAHTTNAFGVHPSTSRPAALVAYTRELLGCTLVLDKVLTWSFLQM